MNNCLSGSLIICCILLSTCMITAIIFVISFLYRLNKILKNVSKITTILGFESKILAPLLLCRKLIAHWLRKKNQRLSQDIEECFRNDDTSSNCMKKIFRWMKWIASALILWGIFRKKD
ncbi:hypothetical protein [Chlamydia avium]|nr:hypothetical protein [Chlamydia avium]EPP37765.1 hypothetical protein CP10743SC13_0354 [Chlamydia psittaci 10_743_SC13]EPP38869.1 hypothetical protein CP10881SC42_0443 [Chlamydia avium]